MNHLKLLILPLVLGALFALSADTALAKSEHRWGSGVTVSISADGTALVRGATVTNVGAGKITAKTSWGSRDLTWDVDTDSETNYVGLSEGSISRSDIKEGDTISFTGALTGSLSVAADTVRVWTNDVKRATISGIVTDTDRDSFVVKWNKRLVTVETTASTTFAIRGYDTAEFSDIEVDDRVNVTGLYSTGEDELTATRIVIGAEHKHDGKRPWDSWSDFWHKLKVKFDH